MRFGMLLPAGLLLLTTVGCGRTEYRDTGGLGVDDTADPGRPDAGDALTLTPDVVSSGEVLIASLQAADPTFDYAAVSEVIFYGGEDVVICATRERQDELLISIGVPDGTPAGTLDLVVRMADGENHFLKDALTIIDAGTAE